MTEKQWFNAKGELVFWNSIPPNKIAIAIYPNGREEKLDSFVLDQSKPGVVMLVPSGNVRKFISAEECFDPLEFRLHVDYLDESEKQA